MSILIGAMICLNRPFFQSHAFNDFLCKQKINCTPWFTLLSKVNLLFSRIHCKLTKVKLANFYKEMYARVLYWHLYQVLNKVFIHNLMAKPVRQSPANIQSIAQWVTTPQDGNHFFICSEQKVEEKSVCLPVFDAPAVSSSSSSSSSSPPSSSFTRSQASLRSILICSWLILLETALLWG